MESLESRLKRIEQRLSSIEKFIAENMGPKTKDLSVRLGRVSEPVDVSGEYRYNYSSDFDPTKMVKAPIHQIDNSVFNERKKNSLNEDSLVTAVSGILLVLALFYLGKFLIEASWMTSTTMLGLGAALALSFIVGGYSLKDQDLKGIHYLPILGLILMYVTIFGATNYYALLPKNIGLAAVLLTSWVSLYVQREVQKSIYEVIACIGAYIVPLYISYGSEQAYTNLYYIVASLSFMLASVSLRLTVLPILGAYLSVVTSGITDYFDNDGMNRILFTLGHFVIYASAYVLALIRQQEALNKLYTYLFYPFVFLFYLFESYYLAQISTTSKNIFAVAFAVSFVLMHQLVKKFAQNKDELTQTMLLGCGSSILAHIVFFSILPPKFRSIFLILLAVAVVKTSAQWLSRNPLHEKIVGFAMMFLIGLSGFDVMLSQYSSGQMVYTVNALIYAVLFFYIAYFEARVLAIKINSAFVSSIAHLFVVSALYGLLKNLDPLTLAGALVGYSAAAIASVYYMRNYSVESPQEAGAPTVSDPAVSGETVTDDNKENQA